MKDLTLDWFLLFIQISILIFIIGNEFFLNKGKNIFAILVPAAILILVQGQAYWIFNQFKNKNYIRIGIGGSEFSLEHAHKANIYYTISILFLAFSFYLFKKVKWSSGKSSNKGTLKPNFISYSFTFGWVIIMAILLVSQIGGMDSALNKPGQMVGGQTLFIISLGLGKWPLIKKLNENQTVKILDLILFALVILITLFNSRFLTSFAVLQLLIVYNYCKKEIKNRTILLMIIPAVVIFLVFGLYRDFAYRFGTIGFEEAFNEYRNPSTDFNVLDWFYQLNVEGFSGLASVLNYKDLHPNEFSFDYGISELTVFFNYIPNSIRTDSSLPFLQITANLKDIYPYTSSVVPSGFELSYGHLGIIGMIFYSSLIGFLMSFFHSIVRKPSHYRIIILIISVQLLNGVRASFFGALMFFGLADLLTFGIYNLFLTRSAKSKILETNNE